METRLGSSEIAGSWPNLSTAPSPLSPSLDPSIQAQVPYLLIGIDFGTTYSGVAYTWSGRLKERNVISIWERGNGGVIQESDKVPTEIAIGSDKSVKWGFQVEAHDNPFKWFKLLLATESVPENILESPQVKRTEQLLDCSKSDLPKKVVSLVGLYLRKLWRHTLNELNKAFGEAVVNGMLFKIVITMPAIWDGPAPHRVREAAKKAGMLDDRMIGQTTLQLVTEPEAAALATLADFEGRPSLEVGDTFVVCDAGGGTVDMISYKVTQKSPIKLEECVEGTGDLCGAIFLDENFEADIRTKMGKTVYDSLKPESKKRLFDNDWERGIKKSFTGQERANTECFVDLPPDARKGSLRKILHVKNDIKGNQIILKQGHVKSFFDPVCIKVEDLVNGQVREVIERTKRPPRAILLVGGFGANDYLYHRLKKAHPGIEIQKPPNAWSAICRGALIKAINDSQDVDAQPITRRVSRLNYGVYHQADFIPGIHLQSDKVWDFTEGRYKADNQIHWYLKRGDNVDEKKPVTFGYYQAYKSAEEYQGRIALRLFKSKSLHPQDRMTHDVQQLCEISCNLEYQFYDLPETENNGDSYRSVDFLLTMVVSGGYSVDFIVRVNGQEQGRKNVNIDFQAVGGSSPTPHLGPFRKSY